MEKVRNCSSEVINKPARIMSRPLRTALSISAAAAMAWTGQQTPVALAQEMQPGSISGECSVEKDGDIYTGHWYGGITIKEVDGEELVEVEMGPCVAEAGPFIPTHAEDETEDEPYTQCGVPAGQKDEDKYRPDETVKVTAVRDTKGRVIRYDLVNLKQRRGECGNPAPCQVPENSEPPYNWDYRGDYCHLLYSNHRVQQWSCDNEGKLVEAFSYDRPDVTCRLDYLYPRNRVEISIPAAYIPNNELRFGEERYQIPPQKIAPKDLGARKISRPSTGHLRFINSQRAYSAR